MPRGSHRISRPWQGALGSLAPVDEGLKDDLRWVAAEQARIASVVVAFARAWVEGDAAGMARCLHPEAMTRLVQVGMPLPPREALERMQAVQARLGQAAGEPASLDIRVLEVTGRSASARAHLGPWLAHLHLTRTGRTWSVVNVLWDWISNGIVASASKEPCND